MAANDTYVVYRGDDVIAIGTRKECAEKLGVRESTIDYYTTPSARKGQTVAERISNDEVIT